MSLLVKTLHLELSESELHEAMREMDDDDDGQIDFDEFWSWWMSSARGASGALRSKVKIASYLATESGAFWTSNLHFGQDYTELAKTEEYLTHLIRSSLDPKSEMEGTSLGVFTVSSKLRRCCFAVIESKLADHFLVMCIVLNLIFLAVQAQSADPIQWVTISNFVINVIFLSEAVFRIIAHGLWHQQNAYLRSGWNIFDAVIIVAVWVPGSNK
jgi:hypothetical protein